MQLHLYEPECCAALCHATVDGHGCFGQLMEGVPVMPLLKIVRSSPHPEAEGFSVHVQCVGRVSTVLEKDSTNITTVEPYQDMHESDAPVEPERFPEEIADIMLLHQGCCGFQKHIDAISQGNVPPVVIPPNVVYTWGHESYVEQFEQPLQEIFQQRCRNLQEVDMDARTRRLSTTSPAGASSGASRTRSGPSASSCHLRAAAACHAGRDSRRCCAETPAADSGSWSSRCARGSTCCEHGRPSRVQSGENAPRGMGVSSPRKLGPFPP